MKQIILLLICLLCIVNANSSDKSLELRTNIYKHVYGHDIVEIFYHEKQGSAYCILDSTVSYLLGKKNLDSNSYSFYYKSINKEIWFDNGRLTVLNHDEKSFETIEDSLEQQMIIRNYYYLLRTFIPIQSIDDFLSNLNSSPPNDSLSDEVIIENGNEYLSFLEQSEIIDYGLTNTTEILYNKQNLDYSMLRMSMKRGDFTTFIYELKIDSFRFHNNISDYKFIPEIPYHYLNTDHIYQDEASSEEEQSNTKQLTLEENIDIKDWNLLDLENKGIKLEDLSGKPSLIFFFDFSCPWCIASMPAIESIYINYREDANIIGIFNDKYGKYQNLEVLKKDVKAFFKEKNLSFRTYLDHTSIIKNYNIQKSPYFLILDKYSNIQKIWSGYSIDMQESLSAMLEQYLP